MATSARNRFYGKITRIAKDGLLVEVELSTLSGMRVASVITEESCQNLGLGEGVMVCAIIKAPWVMLEKYSVDKSVTTNFFSGIVSEIKSSKLVAEVIVTLADGTKMCSLSTMDQVKMLDLQPGKQVYLLFNAFSVILNLQQ